MQRDGLLVVGEPPDQLKSAFSAIAGLHRAFDQHPKAKRGTSLTSCILCAEIAAMTFRAMGLGAKAVPSGLLRITFAPDKRLIFHSIGSVDNHPVLSKAGEPLPGWNGHMIALVDGWVFDPTFWQVDKQVRLPVMMALPIKRQRVLNDGYDGLAHHRGIIGGVGCEIVYVDMPSNTGHEKFWGGRDTRRQMEAFCRDVAKSIPTSEATP